MKTGRDRINREREKIRGSWKRKLLLVLVALLTVAAVICFTAAHVLTGLLASQQEAERWRGENPLDYTQLSCYLPVDEKLGIEQIYEFRQKLGTELHAAALDIDNDSTLYVDAWSTTGKVEVSSALGKGQVSAIAVGGQFFSFHPLRLISGSYISESDLMKDRVLLDEETAWLLYGGTELQGLEVRVNGQPFVVAGVIEREQDFASKKAYTAGMGIYLSYEAFSQLSETAGITCYELTVAEPVKNFGVNLTRENFPIGKGEIVSNSGRFTFEKLLGVAGSFGARSMQSAGMVYPYWENAARLVEDWSSLLLFLGLLFALLPFGTVVVLLVRALRRGKDKVVDDLLPKLVENVQEAVRIRQRRRWEKKHGRHAH